ncbi:hypothetical protein R3P38DRAFT_3518238 [Favolaschia claudopus]|uniref:Uncharacterized protein n=1 Tax=Favolaschia claudopus TaxID=2862362 RepID=A0AAW0BQB2_9AGAR
MTEKELIIAIVARADDRVNSSVSAWNLHNDELSEFCPDPQQKKPPPSNYSTNNSKREYRIPGTRSEGTRPVTGQQQDMDRRNGSDMSVDHLGETSTLVDVAVGRRVKIARRRRHCACWCRFVQVRRRHANARVRSGSERNKKKKLDGHGTSPRVDVMRSSKETYQTHNARFPNLQGVAGFRGSVFNSSRGSEKLRPIAANELQSVTSYYTAIDPEFQEVVDGVVEPRIT